MTSKPPLAPPKAAPSLVPDEPLQIDPSSRPPERAPDLTRPTPGRDEQNKVAAIYETHMTPSGFSGPTSILLITARSDSGPAPKAVNELIRILKTEGVRVFIASPINPPYGYEFKKTGDKFIPIPHRDFSINALWRMYKSVKKHGVTVIHSHGRTAGVYSRLLGFLTKASVVHSYHGVSGEKGIKGAIKLKVDQILARFEFAPLFASEAEEQRALQKGVVRNDRERHVIAGAIDLSRYPRRKSAAIALGKIDRNAPETFNDIRIGALLRNESSQGHQHFLKLATAAGAQGKFTCAGLTRSQLQRFGTVPENLEIVGPVVDPIAWLSSLDVFISTSTSDGQFVNSLEAMAAGAVCLLSNVPAHEKFEQQHAAILFNPGSTEDFSRALNSVKTDKALRDMVLGNSRYMIERFHDFETYKTNVLTLYR